MANKKINQLVSKTSILSTDLFGIGDATTGQLFKKTIAELQAAIGGAVISVNGLVGTVVLDTDDIQELATPTNKWFTDARARAAISLTVTGNSGASTYSSGTGVLNVPTYTLAGLGGITASFLSGASGISYNSSTGVISYSGTVYTDASIRSLFSGGTGITYNSSTGAISYSGTVYTDSSIRALISLTTTGNSGASTYNNTTGVINVPEYTLAGLGGISLTSLSGGTGITYNNTTGAISYSGTVYTDASVRALISASGAVSYNNTTGVISLTSGNLTEATSSVLTITGGTGAVLGSGTSIQVKQASSTVSGFLSSTDWTTFNGKANALSGTTNYVAKFTSSTGIGNSTLQEVSGNLGLGVTPSAWSGVNAIQVGHLSGLSLLGYSGTGAEIASNTYFNGTNYAYATTATATRYVLSSGQHRWFVAPSGTQDANISFTQAMTLTNAGNLGVGTTTPDDYGAGYKMLSINGSTAGILQLRSNNAGIINIVGTSSSADFEAFATKDITFKTGTSTVLERVRVTSAGNVGIGTISPGSTLDVNGNFRIGSGTVSSPGIAFRNSTNSGFYLTDDGSGALINLGIGATNIATFKYNGNVGIGTTSPTQKFQVEGTSFFHGDIIFGLYGETTNIKSNQVLNYLVFGGSENTTFQTYASGWQDRMRLTNGGNFLIGTMSDNGERLYVSGAIRATGTITANSDITLKKNLLKIENALEKVEQINGYTYEFKEDDSKRHAGVIAQEIQTVLPEIVNKGNDGILGVEYGNISALLIEATKEQQIQIKAQQIQINELKALLNK